MIRMDLSSLREKLEAMALRAQHIRPALEAAAPALVESQRAHFDRGGVGAESWEPLKDGSGRKPLEGSGQLRDSIHAVVSDHGIEVRSNLPYAAAHQFGTKTMPARPFLVIEDEDLRRVVQTVLNHIVSGEVSPG